MTQGGIAIVFTYLMNISPRLGREELDDSVNDTGRHLRYGARLMREEFNNIIHDVAVGATMLRGNYVSVLIPQLPLVH